MRLPYPRVSQRKPFLCITVKHADLDQYANNTGTTQLMVYRVQKRGGSPINYPFYQPMQPLYYLPLQIERNRFTFVMDSNLFQYRGGRYKARLQYNGVWLGEMEFDYDKPPVTLDGQHEYHHGV